MKFIKKFEEITYKDISLVGGKNASLGQMITSLGSKGILIPTGFAVTADGYWHFLKYNNIIEELRNLIQKLTDSNDIKLLKKISSNMRMLICTGIFPQDLQSEITKSYHLLSEHYHDKNIDVAVRSSATAEDLPEASFAGQQETFLNVTGEKDLLHAIASCFASLFTDRAIVYRAEKGFDHFQVSLSVGVQKMVRSDKASAGVIFTLDTQTGFKDVVAIESSFGLGEVVVKGLVTPDEFLVHKPTLINGYRSIIKKNRGNKNKKIIYKQGSQTEEIKVDKKHHNEFSLTDDEIIFLARAACSIEDYYSELYGKWMPMDIEWAKDGDDEKIYIVQARPETVHAPRQDVKIFRRYSLQNQPSTYILSGQSIGQQVVAGRVRIVPDVKDFKEFEKGDILVTSMTDPDWVPFMKRAAAIVTDHGGRTCHAAIVSRELGIPAIVGTLDATKKLKNRQGVTIDCSQGSTGYIYDGILEYGTHEIILEELPKIPVKLMINVADPDRAFLLSYLPVDGVGLARVEFIIANIIKIHPMVAIEFEKIKDKKTLDEIQYLTSAYKSISEYVVSSLAQGIASIAAAFYPRSVIVRFSDFKTNEYANLLGGSYFEPKEANPVLGLRGASRYYSEFYKPAFALECAAMRRVRDDMGLKNIQVMLPFVRTVAEARHVLDIMKNYGLDQNKDELKIMMMCEIPSNVVLIDAFSDLFAGFSIGSNDLTQLTLGVDRDSELLASLFDERDEAVKHFMQQAIQGAQKNKKNIGICGQAPSDYPEIAEFLIDCGIDSISLNPDTVAPFLLRYKKM